VNLNVKFFIDRLQGQGRAVTACQIYRATDYSVAVPWTWTWRPTPPSIRIPNTWTLNTILRLLLRRWNWWRSRFFLKLLTALHC